MPNSPATNTALGWLRTGQAPAQRVGEVVRALALLSGEVPVTQAALRGMSPDVELALLVEADARGLLALVATLGELTVHKETAKHTKKLLFRARQRGVVVPDRTSARPPVDMATHPDPLPSFATSFDKIGTQVLFLGGWSTIDGPWCAVGVVSDEEGLLSALYLPDTSRTHEREMMDRLKVQFSVIPVEVPAAFAAGRLRWGLDHRLALGKSVEGDLPEVRRAVSEAQPIHAIEVALDAEDEAHFDDRIAQGAALARDPWCENWLAADPTLLRQLDDGLALPLSTPLPADDAEASRVLAGRRTDAVRSWFDPVRRVRLAERFELSAWLMLNAHRRDQAILAVATARGLRDLQRPIESLGYVTAAMERVAPVERLLAYERRRATQPAGESAT